MELNSELDRLNDYRKFAPVLKEQLRQIKKWGIQNHAPAVYLTILVEEVGEVAKAILQTTVPGPDESSNWGEVIKELTEVMAVAQSMIESIERNQLPFQGKAVFDLDKLKLAEMKEKMLKVMRYQYPEKYEESLDGVVDMLLVIMLEK